MNHTVLVVEDDPVTRDYLAAAIRACAGLELLAVAGSCAEARSVFQARAPRVLLVDLGLPDGDGTELIHEATANPDTDAMVITVFGDERHVVAALEAGATGYLLKDSPLADIGEAVMRLILGGSPISPRIARYLVRRFHGVPQAPSGSAPASVLTDREREVLEVISRGFSYSEVARSLSLSTHTVASHIKHIYRKLAVGSRSEAIYEAANLGLIRLTQD